MKLREKRAEGKENEVESINFCWLMEWNFSAAEGWAPSHNPQKERLTPREQLSLASLLSSATKSIKQKQWNLFDWICCWLAAQRLAAWCGASLIHSIARHSFVQFHQLNWFHWSTEFAFIPFLHSAHKLFVNLYFFQLTHSQQSTIRSWRSNVYNYCYNIILISSIQS